MAIERQSFAQPWTRHMYLSDLVHNRMATYLVLKPAPSDQDRLPPLLAYGGLWLMVDEAHVATIASHPEWRGCGLGEILLVALLQEALRQGAERSTLEVRVGNVVAQTLYLKLGYTVAGRRRRYYQDGEDALIMTTGPLSGPDMRQRLVAAQQSALARLELCLEETL
jgi:ribosomal-protein-alanine N-acetyltransferase